MTNRRRTMSATETADKLGVSETTIRRWQKDFQVPAKKVRGKWSFDEEAYVLFQRIHELKDTCGNDTIRHTIGTIQDEPTSNQNESSTNDVDPAQITLAIENSVSTAVSNAIERAEGLADKLSRATYTIGQQEEKIKQFEEKLLMLPSPVEVNQLELKVQQLEEENKTLKEKQDQAKQHWLIRLMFKDLF